MSNRNRTPRTAALFLSLALAGGALTMTTTAAEAAPTAREGVHAKATEKPVTVVKRLSHAKGQVGDRILIKGEKLATWQEASGEGEEATTAGWVAKTVKFGDAELAANSVTPLSGTTLQVTVPLAGKGTPMVLVGDAVKGPKFTYVANIVSDEEDLAEFSPTSEEGLKGAILFGTHITKKTKVLVGGKAAKFDKATGGPAADGTKYTFDFPAGLTGEQDVTVVDNGISKYLGYVVYNATTPTIVSADLTSVPAEAATKVTLTGNKLDLVTAATYNGTEKVSLAKATDEGTKRVVTIPKGEAAAGAKLVVTTKYGETAEIVINRAVSAKPAVTAVTGAKAAGGEVTITGTNLTGLKTVTVTSKGDTVKTYKGTNLVVVSATSAKVTLPALPDGAPYDIQVTTLAKDASDKVEFYVGTPPAPTVTDATTTDRKVIVITGTNFTGATKVKIGTSSFTTGFVVDSATKITLTLAEEFDAGTWNVEVTAPGGVGLGTGKLVIAE